MRVLVGCEYSGIVRDAFARRGHDAWSCDILDSEAPGNHIKGNLLDYLDMNWDLAILHPPCTHLSVSGARWFAEGKKPMHLREQALDFVQQLMNAPIDYICIANSTEDRITEYVEHLQEHFIYPVLIKDGFYLLPTSLGIGLELKNESLKKYSYPNGDFWINKKKWWNKHF